MLIIHHSLTCLILAAYNHIIDRFNSKNKKKLDWNVIRSFSFIYLFNYTQPHGSVSCIAGIPYTYIHI